MHFTACPSSPYSTGTVFLSVLYVFCPQHSSMLFIIPSPMLWQHHIFLLLHNFFWPQILDSTFPDPYLCKTWAEFIMSLPTSKLHALARLTCCIITITASFYPASLCPSLATEVRISASERFSARFSDILREVFIYQNTARHFAWRSKAK